MKGIYKEFAYGWVCCAIATYIGINPAVLACFGIIYLIIFGC